MDIAGYILGEQLGGADINQMATAGRAALYRGQEQGSGRQVVLKVYPQGHAAAARREIALAQQLSHPHIIAPQQIFDHEDVTVLVIPYLSAGSLDELIAVRGRLPWREVLTVLIPLADALVVAHERQVIHGDISAANILFDRQGKPYFIDFGLARVSGEKGGDVGMTLTDVAPEVARGADPDPATDVFSFGSVALRALTGRSAWDADDCADVVVAATVGQLPRADPQLAPPALVALIDQMVDLDPELRGNISNIALQLRGIGQPEPVALVTKAKTTIAPATVVRRDALRPPNTVNADDEKFIAQMGRTPMVARRRGLRILRNGAVGVVAIGLTVTGAIWAGWQWADATLHGPSSATTELAAAIAATDPVVETVAPRDNRADSPGARHSASAGKAAADGSDDPAITKIPARAAQVETRAPAPDDAGAAVGAARDNSRVVHGALAAVAPEEDYDWSVEIARLTTIRTQAFLTRDPSLLRQVYLPGSPAYAADRARISQLVSQDLSLRSFEHHFADVRRISSDSIGKHVTVQVTTDIGSLAIVNATGQQIAHQVAPISHETLLDLEFQQGRYLISRVREG